MDTAQLTDNDLTRLLRLSAARDRSDTGELPTGALEEEFWSLRDRAYDLAAERGYPVEADDPGGMVRCIREHGLLDEQGGSLLGEDGVLRLGSRAVEVPFDRAQQAEDMERPEFYPCPFDAYPSQLDKDEHGAHEASVRASGILYDDCPLCWTDEFAASIGLRITGVGRVEPLDNAALTAQSMVLELGAAQALKEAVRRASASAEQGRQYDIARADGAALGALREEEFWQSVQEEIATLRENMRR